MTKIEGQQTTRRAVRAHTFRPKTKAAPAMQFDTPQNSGHHCAKARMTGEKLNSPTRQDRLRAAGCGQGRADTG